MSSEVIQTAPIELEPRASGWAGLRSLLTVGENFLVTVTLAAMMIVPLAEILLRRALHTGIRGSSSIVQHLCLLVGMVGGAIAARENRLLSLSNVRSLLKGRLKMAASLFTGAVAAAISALLCVASVQFVLAEKIAGKILAYGVPVWSIQLSLPVGFALITIYLLGQTSGSWKGGLATFGLAAGIVSIVSQTLIPPPRLVVPALITLIAASILGVPVFVTLGGVALILFWGLGQPIASIPVDHYSLVTDPSLPTIPLFTVAGCFLAESGAPKRLVRVFQALFGAFRGGTVIATVLVCAFFTTFTGASGVTILAIGGLLMPVLLADHYKERAALGLVTSAGSLGLLFPPCLPLVLYAIIAHVPIQQMFLGGIVPGIVMLIATAAWGLTQRSKEAHLTRPFRLSEAQQALWDAKWELLLPVVALVSLFSGWATPVEAAAVTALYAFVVETLIYRELSLTKDVPRVMTECGLLVGGVLLVLGVALGFTNYLVDVDFTAQAISWISNTVKSPWVFLLLLNLWLLIVGCLMDIYVAIVIQVPLLVPLGLRFHIDPVHLGIIFLANLEIGYLSPPVGLNLYLSSFRFRKSLGEVTRAALPLAVVLLGAVLMITYVPALTTALPRWFGR